MFNPSGFEINDCYVSSKNAVKWRGNFVCIFSALQKHPNKFNVSERKLKIVFGRLAGSKHIIF